MAKTIFKQRRHPISPNYKWAFVLVSLALLAVAAIVSNSVHTPPAPIEPAISNNEGAIPPTEPVVLPSPPLDRPVVPPAYVAPPILADAKFQQLIALAPSQGKYTYAGKMPAIGTNNVTTAPATGPNFGTLIQNLINSSGSASTTTASSPAANPFIPPTTTTALKTQSFSYEAFADASGFIGVKTTQPSTGSILFDLFRSAAIQPTTFIINGNLLVCPLGSCSFVNSPEKPTFLSLPPSMTKKKSDWLGIGFVSKGTKKVNGRTCDNFEAGNGSTLQTICFDQQTHVPSQYSNALGYSLELSAFQSTYPSIEASYPSSMALLYNQSNCAYNALSKANEATISFVALTSAWDGSSKAVTLEFYTPSQNPLILPNSTPQFIQNINLSGKKGETKTSIFFVPLAQAQKYVARACMGKDCTSTFSCDFSNAPIVERNFQ